MRALLALVACLSLSGCVTISLDEKDRARIDKFLAETKRFNDNIEAVLPKPEPPPINRKLAKVSNE